MIVGANVYQLDRRRVGGRCRTAFGETPVGTLSVLIDTGNKFPTSGEIIDAFLDNIKHDKS